MTSYIYNGKSKQYASPLRRKNKKAPLFSNMAFILCGSHPIEGFKVNGSNLLFEYQDSEILEYQLDIIHSVCEDPEIIVISGVSHSDFVKHDRRNEFILIENQLYEFSNSAEDLKIGMHAIRSPHAIFIDNGFIPTLDTFKYLANSKDRVSKVFLKSTPDKNYVGANIGSGGIINNFTFSTNNTITGMFYITTNDIDRLRKKSITKKFLKNKFAFEILSDLKLKAVVDESKSIIVVR